MCFPPLTCIVSHSLTVTFQPVEDAASKYCENICIEDIENRLVDTVGMEKLG